MASVAYEITFVADDADEYGRMEAAVDGRDVENSTVDKYPEVFTIVLTTEVDTAF